MEPSDLKQCPRCGTQYDAAATFCQRDGATLVFVEGEPDPYIGTVLLDQFRIEEVIGSGGMGTVYRARQTTLERDVAIKILHRDLVQNPDAVRRFQREAKVTTAFDHPNLVRVFLFGQLPDGSLYLVMEYLRGRPLVDVLRAEGPMPPARALHFATQICDGIGVAHEQGVVHRDVKPENVLVVARGREPDFVKVLDFGIARFLWGEHTVATQSGLIFGTARYISPEGASGEVTDARSDVYSIAVLTYQLLSGETPFESGSPVALLMKHIHEPPPPLRSRARGADVPPAIADVVMRALAKNPDARYADANRFGEALRQAAASSGILLTNVRLSLHPVASPPALLGPPGIASPTSPFGGGAPTPAPFVRAPALHPAAIPPAAGPVPSPAAPSPTLAAAPSPFGQPTGAMSVPGLPARPSARGAALTLLAAFVLGAAAVVGGAFALGAMRGGEQAADVESLEAQARRALARGAIDAPPGDNVAELTLRILAHDPDHRGAREIRAEAARRLFQEAETARGQGFADEARARYTRVLALAPNDAATVAALAALDREREEAMRPPQPPGIRAIPEEPALGEPVTIVAVLPEGVRIPAGEHPHFAVWRGGRRLADHLSAAPTAADARAWAASYVFRRTGRHTITITLPGEGEDARLRANIDVGPAANARSEPPTTTELRRAVRANGSSGVSGSDGIDWNVPPISPPSVDTSPPPANDPPPPAHDPPPPANDPPPPAHDPPPPPPPEEPPPPWTGGAGWL